MSAIRPDLPAPTPGPGPAPAPAAARAAQAAFFRAALQGAVAPAPSTPPGAPSTADAAPADRPMRPGALLDIRV